MELPAIRFELDGHLMTMRFIVDGSEYALARKTTDDSRIGDTVEKLLSAARVTLSSMRPTGSKGEE
jgi:hypothetical protein